MYWSELARRSEKCAGPALMSRADTHLPLPIIPHSRLSHPRTCSNEIIKVFYSFVSHPVLAGDEAAIWEAVLLLEAGLVKCPADFQFKLLLVKLYLILGGYERDKFYFNRLFHSGLAFVRVRHSSVLSVSLRIRV